jgi:hypothetical protein
MRVGGQDNASPIYPIGYLVPFVQWYCWASGQVWTIAEIFSPPGFDPRTVQTVATPIQDYNAAIYVRNKVRHL